MKTFARAILFLALSVCGVKAQYTSYLTIGTETTLGNQAGWYWWMVESGALYGIARPVGLGTTNVAGNLFFKETIPAGNYRMWIKAQSYNTSGFTNLVIGVNPGGGEVLFKPINHDIDGYWTIMGTQNVPTPTTSFAVRMYREEPPGTFIGLGSPGILGMFITQDPTGIVTADDFFQHWDYPTAMVTNAPIAGNYIHNGSFENGTGDVSIFPNTSKMFAFRQLWSTNVARTGTRSIEVITKVPGYESGGAVLRTTPFLVRSNKYHSVSVWMKGSIGAKASISIIPIVAVPAGYGFPAHTNYTSGTVTTVSTNWTQVKIDGASLLEYPAPAQYAVEFKTVPPHVGTNLFFDDLWFGEGTNAPAYAPRMTREIQLRTSKVGNRFYWDNNDSYIIASVYNSGSAFTDTVHYEIYNYQLDLVSSGTVPVNCPTAGTADVLIDVNSLAYGPFRITAWLSNGSEQETYFSRMHSPKVMAPEDSMFGGHFEQWMYTEDIDDGLRWNRVFSPLASFRWDFIEPSYDNFVWTGADVAMDAIEATGQSALLVGYRGDTVTWNNRSYFTTETPTGTFQIGETLTQGAVSGKITWVGTTAHNTGYALQLSNVLGGTFTIGGGTITGGTSGATATLKDPQINSTWAIDRYTNYFAKVIQRYRPRGIKYYGGPNEPHLNSAFDPYPVGSGAGTNFGLYAETLRSAIAAGRAVCPDCKFLGVGGVSQEDQVTNVLRYLTPSTLTNLHAVDFHLYSLDADQNNRAANMVALAATYGITNVWNSEAGIQQFSSWLGSLANWRNTGLALLPYRDSEDQMEAWTYSLIEQPENAIFSLGVGMKKWFLYDNRWYHGYSDPGNGFKTANTELDFQDTLKPFGVAIRNLAWSIDGGAGKGRLTTPAASVGYSFLVNGTTPWMSIKDLSTNRVMSWALAPAQYEIYDVFGNRLIQSAGEVHFTRRPVLVKATGCSSLAQLQGAVAAATWSTESDNDAPNILIARGQINFTPLEAHRVRLRWLGWDEYFLEGARFKGVEFRTKLDAEAFTVWSGYTFREIPTPASGAHAFVIEARDEAGNTSTKTVNFTMP